MRTAFLASTMLAFACSALGGGSVSHLTQLELESALSGGGTVLFAVSGTLTLTNTITISQDSVIDANGNTVTISGGNGVRLFQLSSNVNFWCKGLTLSDGRVLGGNAFGAGILN